MIENNDSWKEYIKEMWFEDKSLDEMAEYIFTEEDNYNNSNIESGQYIYSFNDLRDDIEDYIANNSGQWELEREEAVEEESVLERALELHRRIKNV